MKTNSLVHNVDSSTPSRPVAEETEIDEDLRCETRLVARQEDKTENTNGKHRRRRPGCPSMHTARRQRQQH